MRRTLPLLLLLALGLVFACTDGQAPTDVSTGGRASVVLAPRFSSFPASDAEPIVKVSIRMLDAATDSVLTTEPIVLSVDPDASSWELPIEVRIPSGSDVRVVFEMELLNASGEVEFSVRTSPMRLVPGTQPNPVSVSREDIGRGPASNFAIQSVALATDHAAMTEGDTVELAAAVQPSGVSAKLFWRSLNPEVAEVESETGSTARIVGALPGTAKIEVSAGSHADTAVVEVGHRIAAVVVSPSDTTLRSLHEEVTLTARVVNPSGEEVPGTGVVWSLSEEGVLKGLGNGRFEAVGNGSVEVGVAVDGMPEISARATVTVEQAVAEIVLSAEIVNFSALGLEAALQAVALDAGGTEVPGRSLAWSSSDTTIATVSPSGVVRAVGNGMATVAVSADGVSATAVVVVFQIPAAVHVDPAEIMLHAVGDTVRLYATVVDSAGHTIADPAVSWSSDAPAVATVDTTGLVTAVEAGTTVVTASAGDLTATATVSVSVPPPGRDIVVVNDMNAFDNEAMVPYADSAWMNNRIWVRNLVDFTAVGSRSAGTVVWFDRGRNSPCGFDGWCGDEALSEMRAVISGAGYTIAEAGALTAIPAEVKVIFLWNPMEYFTVAEVNGLKQFASEGGRLIFIGENVGFYGEGGIAVENQLLYDLGSQMSNVGNYLDCDYNNLPATSLRPHQITEGMDGVRVACASEIIPGPDDYIFLYDSSNTYAIGGVARIDVTPLEEAGASVRVSPLRAGSVRSTATPPPSVTNPKSPSGQ